MSPSMFDYTSLRQQFREYVSTRPNLWRLSNVLRGTTSGEVSRNTDLLIDGYPRSANSRIEAYVSLVYPSLRLAHHRHVSAQFKLAKRWNVPAILLIRNPSHAVASLIYRNDNRAIAKHALEAWIRLNKNACALSETVLVCKFDTAINDPFKITKELHGRFGQKFEVDPDTAKILETRIDAEIGRIAQKRGKAGKLNYGEHLSPEAKKIRKDRLNEIRSDLESKHSERLGIANRIFKSLEQKAI